MQKTENSAFNEFNFSSGVLEAIDVMGYKQPTPIQEQAIPEIMQGRDLIGCAQTGTGKTAAFLLPVIEQITRDPSPNILCLVIVPTRELAIQIDNQIQGFAYYTDVSSIAVYGGGDAFSWEVQKKALTSGVNIVIATPGRFISHLNLGYVQLDQLRYLILDEADRMLDMGFYEDILKVVKYLPKERQNLLFSATMPPKIRSLAKKILHQPAEISLALAKPAEGVRQRAYLVYNNQKAGLLAEILKERGGESTIIFTSTKANVNNIRREASSLGYPVKAIHSDLDQKEREEVLNDFVNRKFNILVATDILSRGIDIEDIQTIINYEVPRDAEDYVHRVGRTARASKTGTAITFVSSEEQYRLKRIEDLIEKEVEKFPLPDRLGPGPDYSPGKKRGGGGRRGNKRPFNKGKRKGSYGKRGRKGNR